ncbi:MAG TPA: MFS transporter [Dehalococcoidia bacterium]|nr:MFS transporter [Dehalococcoidia bacterium]
MFPSQIRRLTWAGYFGFVLIGAYISAIGPGLPSIAARAQMPLAQAGTVLTAIFAGGLVMSPVAGRAMDRLGRRPLLIFGCAVHAGGCLGLSLARSWPQVLASGVLMGVGDSVLVVGYHVLLAELYPHEGGAALNRLNVFFGVGALLGPALAAASLGLLGDIRYVLWLVSASQIGAIAVLLSLRVPGRAAPPAVHGGGLGGALRRPLFWWLALLITLYVALEVGLGNWTFTYLHRGGVGDTAASIVTSGYWLGLMLGRALSPAVLKRLREPALLAAVSLASLALSALLFAGAGWRSGGAVEIMLLGLAFGPVWPLAFAVATREFAAQAGAVSGLLAAAGSIGGLAGPWLLGLLLVEHGAYAGMVLICAASAGMAGCALLALRGLSVTRAPARTAAIAHGEW